MFYAEIILPLLGGVYTYSCAEELVVGSVVSVPLGRRTAVGVVRRVFPEAPSFSVKEVGEVLFSGGLVSSTQFALWDWLAEYYMCTPGEVMRAALPTILRKGDFVPYKRKKNYELRPGRAAKRITTRQGREANYELPRLSAAQRLALDRLLEATQEVALLFGVPSSGKSEVCFHAIAAALQGGEDVLMLLPEISLSTQFIGRVKKVFGGDVILYHSGLTDKRRADSYLQLLGSEGRLVIGTRSSIFLPFKKLGLVVVDEEQDSSYKQQDPAPRYNARDAAIVLARLHGAKTILTSATPSLESWLNVQNKYALVELSERFGGTEPPEVIVSDTLRAAKRGERKSHFNKELTDRLKTTLAKGEQAILFQNRRGVAPYVECAACGWVPRCDHCAIPMTVHRGALRQAQGGALRCHYCGAAQPLPTTCPACGGALETKGFGTEKIEDELAALYPSARIVRLDRDSAASEKSYNNIIGTFDRGEADILVGTQMVTKGLDFAGVSLVGVLNADNLMNHPDFRASERAFQLLAQVAGRAGRRGARGEVVVQTAAPGSLVINRAVAGDYRSMAFELLRERFTYGYPPYGRLISVMLRHRDREVLSRAAQNLNYELRITNYELLGPQQPVTEKVKGDYALMFLLKIPRNVSVKGVKAELAAAIKTINATPEFRHVIITPNVDPQ